MIQDFDILIKNANIIDGSGEESYIADIGVIDGKIKFIGLAIGLNGKEVIDCEGLFVSPGFIDIHSHNDLKLHFDHTAIEKLSQGVTTEVTGNCGISLAPVRKKTLPQLKSFLRAFIGNNSDFIDKYTSYNNYFKYLSELSLSINYAFLIGHGTVRAAVLGFENREPTSEELKEMKNIVREAMENGAIGLSTGLIYPPGVYAKEEEIIELCKVVKEYNGIYTTHMRNESDEIIQSIEETINVAHKTGISVIISHHKITGKGNKGLSKKTLHLIKQAIGDGYDISLDQFPYNAGSTQLNILIPPNYKSKGISVMIENLKNKKIREEIKNEMLNPSFRWENMYGNCGGFNGVMVVNAPRKKEAEGKTITEYAKLLNKDEFETYFDLLIDIDGGGLGIFFAISEEDIENILKFPYTMIGTDGAMISIDTKFHPRAIGTYPKILEQYVREKGIFSLEEAIRRMTSLPAEKARLRNKGLIEVGYDADLVIFDFDTIKDNSSYINPGRICDGILNVIVNGKITYKNGECMNTKSGKIFRL